MQPQIYENLSKHEDKNWWHVVRRDLIRHFLESCELPDNAQILDLGCGTGGTTGYLSRFGSVTGIDKSEMAVALAREKQKGNIEFVSGDVNDLVDQFREARFNLITSFNVFYHTWVKNESAVLDQCHKLLRPNGWILINEPAFKVLSRDQDVKSMGRTRYTKNIMHDFLVNSGFEPVKSMYINPMLFPVALMGALGRKAFMRRDKENGVVWETQVPHPLVNNLMKLYFRTELLLTRSLKPPFGVSLIILAKRK